MNTSFLDYLSNLENNAEISIYCTSEQNNLNNFEKIKNGESYIYKLNLINFNKNLIKNNNFYGFSIKFFEKNNLESILSKINIIKKENIENKTIYYGVANGLCFSNYINLQKANVQVADCGNYFVVGSPIILGAY